MIKRTYKAVGMLLAAVALFAGVTVVSANSDTAKAGVWVPEYGNPNGWGYLNDNGTYKTSQWFQDTDGSWYYFEPVGRMMYNRWEWIDGNYDGVAECYCFSPSGAAYINTTTPDGYVVDSNGAWTVNGIVQNKNVSETSSSSTTGSSTGSSGSSSSSSSETGNSSSNDGGYTMSDYAYAYDIPTYYKMDEKWAYTPATKENIVEFINDFRANFDSKQNSGSDRNVLEESDELDTLAETRAHEMAEENVLTHTRPDGTGGSESIRYASNGKQHAVASEICASGWSESDSVANRMSGFIKSKKHCFNLYRTNYSYAGVGICDGYICINFAGDNFMVVDD